MIKGLSFRPSNKGRSKRETEIGNSLEFDCRPHEAKYLQDENLICLARNNPK